MRAICLIRLALSALPLLVAGPALAQPAGDYSAPPEFMELFFDFTGSNEPDDPAGQPTLGQMLTQSVVAQEAARGGASPPLVPVVGFDIHVHDPAAEDAGRIAQEAGVKTLVLSYLTPAIASVSDETWRAAAAKHVKGEIVVAQDPMVI